MNFFISFGLCSTQRLSNYTTLFAFTNKDTQRGTIELNSTRFIICAPSFILGNLFLE